MEVVNHINASLHFERIRLITELGLSLELYIVKNFGYEIITKDSEALYLTLSTKTKTIVNITLTLTWKLCLSH